MKYFMLLGFALAMCLSTSAFTDERVTATSESEVVVDVGKADVFADQINPVSFTAPVAAIERGHLIQSLTLPYAVAIDVAEDVGWRHECDDYKYKDLVTNGNATNHYRHARDGLSC